MKVRRQLNGTRSSAAVILGLFAAAFAACGDLEAPPIAHPASILAGTDVANNAWPNVVWLDVGCTGVLLHERLVVFAGHCGIHVKEVWSDNSLQIATITTADGSVRFAPADGRVGVATKRCAQLEAGYGEGTDLAYCFLSHSMEPFIKVPVALGCEKDDVAGSIATLVGYGAIDDGRTAFGTKRVTSAVVTREGSEYLIGTAQSGTCPGDSGGPAFIRVGRNQEWRMLGILSSGVPGKCGPGWYTPLSEHIDWLEKETQLELSPCFVGSMWRPSPLCMHPQVDDAGLWSAGGGEPSSTCGNPAAVTADATKPTVEIVELELNSAKELATGRRQTDVRLVVAANDEMGQGIESVTVTVVGDGSVSHESVDQLAPYVFEFRSDQRSVVALEACDFAGNCTRTAPMPLTVDSPAACSLQTSLHRQLSGSATFTAISVGIFLHHLRRRMRHRVNSTTREARSRAL